MNTPRLAPLIIDLHPRQLEVFSCPKRFRILVAGRRFGKTHLALVELLYAMQGKGKIGFYVGPTDDQSKRVAWDRLKEITRPFWSRKPLEVDKRIDLCWGSVIYLYGGWKPDALRGGGIDFAVLDEFAQQKPEIWTRVIRPALSDRKGRALFIGTPQGLNHFYDLYLNAQTDPHWAAFHFTTEQGGIVDKDEVEFATHDLDQESFRQEYEAEFSTIGLHRVYHAFNKEANIAHVSFEGTLPLIWAIDFNVNPMCMLLMQRVGDIVNVLEEIIIKPDAHTQLACERFYERAALIYNQTATSHRPLVIKIYGDASGYHRRTAGVQTDWAIIKDSFDMWRGTYKPQYYMANVNPFVRDRVNCVNSRLRNRAEESRIFIHPQCKELIRDLSEVSWALDLAGRPTDQINKSDKSRTHTSDALGYYISQEFHMKPKIGEKPDGRLLF